MEASTIQQFRADVVARRNLPTIPAVLTKILSLVDQEAASGRELVAVVEQDQVLTGKILRLANSAFFGQARRVATIPRAVLVLGYSTVRNLALGVKVWDALAGGLARQRLEDLWAHAMAVAVTTRALAQRLHQGDADEGFTAGLLHDAGRLVMAMRFKENYWQAIKGASDADPIDALERAAFTIDHAEVGAWLFEAWNLPPEIVEAVRQHHQAEPTTPVARLLATTNRLVVMTDPTTGRLRPEAAPAFAPLAERGVTPEEWAELIGRVQGDAGS
jgi:putative nucleotidyltransferase with HDIG domain